MFDVALENLMTIRMEVRACPTESGVRFQAIFSCLRCTSYANIKTTSATIRAANVIQDSNTRLRVAGERTLSMLQTRPTRMRGIVSASFPNCN